MCSSKPSSVAILAPNEDQGVATKRWIRSRKLLSRSKYVMDGHELSEYDNQQISEMLYLWYHVIQDISFRSGILTRSCSTKALTFGLARYDGKDIKSVVKTLKFLLSVIREYNPHNGDVGVKTFRRIVLANVSKEDLTLIEPVWSFTIKLVKTGCEDVSLFRDVNTMLQFPTRLTLRDVDWIEADALQDYLDFEETLKKQEYPQDIIEELNAEARTVLSDFKITDNDYPVNGNGATAEVKRGLGETYKFFRMRKSWMSHQIDNTIGFELPDWLHQSTDIVSDASLAARYQLVPKGIDKKRGVSLEPVIHMYYQQMVFQALDRHFRVHPELHICLQKQEYNRDLAALGSAMLHYGTADLSSASDSVTITLVKSVFKNTPLYPWLLRTRTRFCDVDDGVQVKRVELEKFAPMGSALCFPVECLIFSLIIRVASKRVGVDRYYRVYGDDMIIHRDVWDEAIEILTDLHFIVNLDKSFGPGSEFTESCGIECLNGFDVSPMRISRKWQAIPAYYRNGKKAENISELVKSFNGRKRSHRRRINTIRSHMSPNQLEGQIEFLERLLAANLYGTAYEVYKDIRRQYGDVLLDDAEASLRLAGYRLSASCVYRQTVYNKGRQSLDAFVTTTVTEVDNGEDSINYYLTLQTMARRTGFRLYEIEDSSIYPRLIQAMPPDMVANRKSGPTRSRVVRKRVPKID